MPFTFWCICRHYMCVNAHAHVCIVWVLTERGRACSEAGAWRLVGLRPSIFINQAFQGAVRGSIMRVITQAGCQSYYHRDPSLEITLTLLLVK